MRFRLSHVMAFFSLFASFSVFAHDGDVGLPTTNIELKDIPTELISDTPASEEVTDTDSNDDNEVAPEPSFNGKEIPPGALEKLRVIGRGIQNRRTGEAIVLACVGENLPGTSSPSCKELRHVKIKEGSKEATFIGDTFQVIGRESEFSSGESILVREPTTMDLKQMVRQFNKGSKKHKKFENKQIRQKIIGRLGEAAYGTSLVCLGVLASAGAGPVAVLPVIGSIALIIGVDELLRNPLRPNSGQITEMMANQDGWSWSVNPKKVTAKSYHWFERYLNHN